MTRWHVEDTFGKITTDPEMVREYGFLIQAGDAEMAAIDCGVILGKSPDGYVPSRPVARSQLEACMKLYEDRLLRAS